MSAYLVQADGLLIGRYVLEVLSTDDSPLSRLAEIAIQGGARFRAVVACEQNLPEKVNPKQSLHAIGRAWVPDPGDARKLLAFGVLRVAQATQGWSVSASQPMVKPTDGFLADAPLFVVRGPRVFSTAEVESSPEIVAQIIGTSEGYPPGVVCVHRGPPEAPHDAVWFCVSAFDGESFLVWEEHSHAGGPENLRIRVRGAPGHRWTARSNRR